MFLLIFYVRRRRPSGERRVLLQTHSRCNDVGLTDIALPVQLFRLESWTEATIAAFVDRVVIALHAVHARERTGLST